MRQDKDHDAGDDGGAEPVRYLGIEFTASSVREMDGARVAVSIPRERVISIDGVYGFTAERLLLQLLLWLPLAAGVLTLSLLAIRKLLMGEFEIAHGRGVLLVAFLTALAVLMSFRALRRGPYLPLD